MGVGTLTTAIAPAIGPTYGGIMTSHFTWNHIFLFLVPILILSLIIGWFAIPEMAVQKRLFGLVERFRNLSFV